MSETQDAREVQPVLEELLPSLPARTRFEETSAALEAAALIRTFRRHALSASGTHGISQTELAQRTGLTPARISQLEKGDGSNGPTYAVLRKIAHACGIEWAVFMHRLAASVAARNDIGAVADVPSVVPKDLIPAAEQHPRPSPIDIHVGTRIRLRRTLLGMSQEQLGDALGIRHQQVQEYESGVHRVSAARLFDLSRVLDVSLSFFFEEMPDNLMSSNDLTYTLLNVIRCPGLPREQPDAAVALAHQATL